MRALRERFLCRLIYTAPKESDVPKRSIVRIEGACANGCLVLRDSVRRSAIQVSGCKPGCSARVLRRAGFCLAGARRSAANEVAKAAAFDELAASAHQQRRLISQSCFRCGASEKAAVLLPAHTGQDLWVCTTCLPALIHRLRRSLMADARSI